MMRSFKGITALVTGASSGIGKALARELAGAGANLVLTARNAQRLEEEASELRRQFKVEVRVFACDLSQPENCQKLFEFSRREGLAVDLLVNNAGFAHYGPFEEHPAQDLESMLRLNVEALTALTRLYLPSMKSRGNGGIINVASTAAFQPIPYLAVYAATKAFVLSFSEALWMECREYGVRVFCICPGNTETAFHDVAGIDQKRRFCIAKASDVARFTLKKFLRTGRSTAIYGFRNKLMIFAERLVPRALVVFFTDLIYKPSKDSARLKAQSPK